MKFHYYRNNSTKRIIRIDSRFEHSFRSNPSWSEIDEKEFATEYVSTQPSYESRGMTKEQAFNDLRVKGFSDDTISLILGIQLQVESKDESSTKKSQQSKKSSSKSKAK